MASILKNESPPVISGVATLYKYEPFSYVYTTSDPINTTLQLICSPEITPFVTSTPTSITFASITGYQTNYSNLSFKINLIDSTNTILETYSFIVQVNVGRFFPPAVNTTYDLYQNENISYTLGSNIILDTSGAVNQVYSAPSIPVGLIFFQTDLTGNHWRIQGTPAVQSALSNYQIIGRNTSNSTIVTTFINMKVSPERMVITIDPSSNITNMNISNAITTRTITSFFPTYGSYNFEYVWNKYLPDGISFANNVGSNIPPSTFSFTPIDPSYTMLVQGTPTLAAAYSFANANISNYNVPVLARQIRTSSVLSNTFNLNFSFDETVLFSNPNYSNLLYVGDDLTVGSNIRFDANTYFSNAGTPMSTIFSPDLRADLSINFVGGSGYLTSLTGPTYVDSNTFTLRAINTNGKIRDALLTIQSINDSVSFVSPTPNPLSTISNFVFSRDVTQPLPGYYNAPIQFNATAASGSSVTYSTGDLAGTGLSLSNGYLVGIPISVIAPSTLNVTATADKTGVSATTSIQFDIQPDSASWFFTGFPPSDRFIQNKEITTDINVIAITLSGQPVVFYSAKGLPNGISLSSQGKLTGTPTESGTFNVRFEATTAYTTLIYFYTISVVEDLVLLIPTYSVISNGCVPFTPGDIIPPIKLNFISYSGVPVSNVTFSSNDHNSFGVALSSNVISGLSSNEQSVNSDQPRLLYPSEPIVYTISANSTITNLFDILLETTDSRELKGYFSDYDSNTNTTTIQYVNLNDVTTAGVTVNPNVTKWYTSTQLFNTKLTNSFYYLNYFSDDLNGYVTKSKFYVKTSTDSIEYVNNADNYNFSLNQSLVDSNINNGFLVYSANNIFLRNSFFNQPTLDIGLGAWYDFTSSTLASNAPALIAAYDGIWDLSNIVFVDSNIISDSTNFYGSPFLPDNEGVNSITDFSTGTGIILLGANVGGTHSILVSTPPLDRFDQSNSFTNITFNPVINEFGKIAISSAYTPGYQIVVGSELYDPYEPLWNWLGPCVTVKSRDLTDQTYTFNDEIGCPNFASFSVTSFNSVITDTTIPYILFLEGISYDGIGFVPELYTKYGSDPWVKLDLETFTPSPVKFDYEQNKYGPIVYGPFQYVDYFDPVLGFQVYRIQNVYITVINSGLTKVYKVQTIYGDQPNFNISVIGQVSYNTDTPIVSLKNSTQMYLRNLIPKPCLNLNQIDGPAFPNQQTNITTYLYIKTEIVVIPPISFGIDPVFLYVDPTTLPQGIQFDTLTGRFSGYPTAIIRNFPVTVYAQQSRPNLRNVISTITFYWTVLNPYIVREQTSAGAYTALLRQYTIANGAESSRDSLALPNQETTLGAFMAFDGPNVTSQISPDPKCGCKIVPVIIFKPTDITNCVLWLDANDNTTIDVNEQNQLVNWRDKSINNRNFTPAITNFLNTPVLTTFNEKSVFYFNDSYIRSFTNNLTIPSTNHFILIVYTPSQLNRNTNIINFGNFRFGNYITLPFYNTVQDIERGYISWYSFALRRDVSTLNVGATLGKINIVTANINSGTQKLTRYVGTTGFTNQQNNSFYASPTSQVLSIGGNNPSASSFEKSVDRFFQGNIAEVIVYDRSLSQEEETSLVNYLTAKWY